MSLLLDTLFPVPVGATSARLIVALSGGLDSTALLHALTARWRDQRPVHAVHVHHGLQTQADAWATHCAALCKQLQVPLQIIRVQVDRSGGDGLEAAARRARHAAFAQVMTPGDVLVAAHHQDDQAETFLLRALRASGPDGLAAIRPWRVFAEGWLWRPWLDIPRADIATYAHQHALRWIQDDSNADTTLDRNFLRNQVLPLLSLRWPHAALALARSAALSAQASDLLVEHDQTALLGARIDDLQVLSVQALQSMRAPQRARVLRTWLRQRGLPPFPARGIAQLETSLLIARSDAQPRFQWEDACLRRWGDQLYASRCVPPLSQNWQAVWDGSEVLRLPNGGRLQLCGVAAFEAPVQVTARRGGERITLPGRRHSHALKHVLQDLRMPPWQREQLPLLRDTHGAVLAAGQSLHAARFSDWLKHQAATLRWFPPGHD